MAGFKTDGGVGLSSVADTVVFLLKSSGGNEIKTYQVPVDKADEFARSVQSDEPNLRKDAGEVEPLRLIKIQRCF
jgi:hypothetical protein